MEAGKQREELENSDMSDNIKTLLKTMSNKQQKNTWNKKRARKDRKPPDNDKAIVKTLKKHKNCEKV